MKNIFKFVIFIICIIGIFFIPNLKILGAIFLFNILIVLHIYRKKNKNFSNLKVVILFIFFTVTVNTIFNSLDYAILIAVRLLIAYILTYIFSGSISTLEFADTIQILLAPLKIFKVDVKNISIIVSIAICMIPILKDEIEQIKYTLKARGCKVKPKNINLFIEPLFISILKRTNYMEKTLISKGYN